MGSDTEEYEEEYYFTDLVGLEAPLIRGVGGFLVENVLDYFLFYSRLILIIRDRYTSHPL